MDENKQYDESELGQDPALDEEDEIVELEDEEGKIAKFRHVATVDYENDWYVFFSPAEELDGLSEDEVIIFKLGADEGGADVFLPIEDDALLDAVYNEYVRIMEEDDDCCGCEGCGHDHDCEGEEHSCGEHGCDCGHDCH